MVDEPLMVISFISFKRVFINYARVGSFCKQPIREALNVEKNRSCVNYASNFICTKKVLLLNFFFVQVSVYLNKLCIIVSLKVGIFKKNSINFKLFFQNRHSFFNDNFLVARKNLQLILQKTCKC